MDGRSYNYQNKMNDKDNYHEYCIGGFSPDDIVITGMAGRFPQCENIAELKEGLYSQKQLLFHDNERFEAGAYELPFGSSGSIKNLDKFEPDYFCLPHNVINCMDAASRKTLEVTYEAIADAGYDPSSLDGKIIGVYNSTIPNENLILGLRTDRKFDGCSWLHSINAHRINYHFNFVGPSVNIGSACSSSLSALIAAYRDIQSGSVDAAVVSACQVNLLPETYAIYHETGILSPTGTLTPFDERANGFVRGEAVTTIFLQKALYARRVYASIVNVESVTSGFVPEGISVPSLKLQTALFRNILNNASLKPEDIEYIEAHGTGTKVGDGIELRAIEQVYCNNNRKEPVYVGSVKSNIGHTEAASGLCGIIKTLLAFETGEVAPNYDLKTPLSSIDGIKRGKIKILDQALPLTKPYIPLNSFGLGGTLLQVLLKQNPNLSKRKKSSKLLKLVLFSGTCESAVQYLFDYIKNAPDLPEELFTLLNQLSFCRPMLKPYRGYLLNMNDSSPVESINFCSSDQRPVWFVYAGVGSHWKGMGLQLMKIDVFAESMRKCSDALKPHGFNLLTALQSDDDDENVFLTQFTGITAIQVLSHLLNPFHFH